MKQLVHNPLHHACATQPKMEVACCRFQQEVMLIIELARLCPITAKPVVLHFNHMTEAGGLLTLSVLAMSGKPNEVDCRGLEPQSGETHV